MNKNQVLIGLNGVSIFIWGMLATKANTPILFVLALAVMGLFIALFAERLKDFLKD